MTFSLSHKLVFFYYSSSGFCLLVRLIDQKIEFINTTDSSLSIRLVRHYTLQRYAELFNINDTIFVFLIKPKF